MKNLIVLLIVTFSLFSCSTEVKNSVQGEMTLIDKDGMKLVSMGINDKKSLLILDSGAKETALDKSAATRLKVKFYESDDSVHGIGGVSTLYKSSKYKLIIFNDTIQYSSNVTDLHSVREAFDKVGIRIDGVLGADFLKKNGCIIDYPQNKLSCNGFIK